MCARFCTRLCEIDFFRPFLVTFNKFNSLPRGLRAREGEGGREKKGRES